MCLNEPDCSQRGGTATPVSLRTVDSDDSTGGCRGRLAARPAFSNRVMGGGSNLCQSVKSVDKLHSGAASPRGGLVHRFHRCQSLDGGEWRQASWALDILSAHADVQRFAVQSGHGPQLNGTRTTRRTRKGAGRPAFNGLPPVRVVRVPTLRDGLRIFSQDTSVANVLQCRVAAPQPKSSAAGQTVTTHERVSRRFGQATGVAGSGGFADGPGEAGPAQRFDREHERLTRPGRAVRGRGRR